MVASDNTVKGEGEAEPEEALQAFRANHHAALLRIMTIPKRFNRYIIRHRQPIENWTMGCATLLGDAAHPMVQYLAQGAAMALEDALCLAWCVDEAQGEFNAAFQRYQERRIVRASRVQVSSRMLDPFYHARGVERLVRNAVFEGRSTEEFYNRLAWLYEFARLREVTAVTGR